MGFFAKTTMLAAIGLAGTAVSLLGGGWETQSCERADIVVLGTLHVIADIVYWDSPEGDVSKTRFRFFYDCGEIEVAKLLKGGADDERLPMAWPVTELPLNPEPDSWPVVSDVARQRFTDGQFGVWFLVQGDERLKDYLRCLGFVSVDSLGVVKKALAEPQGD